QLRRANPHAPILTAATHFDQRHQHGWLPSGSGAIFPSTVPGPAFRPASDRLPRLRADLDLMPSPFPERPGLLIRDPYRFSDATLVVPPLLVRCLGCFDGQHSGLDLRATLARLTGAVAVSEIADHLVEALAGAGMLDD